MNISDLSPEQRHSVISQVTDQVPEYEEPVARPWYASVMAFCVLTMAYLFLGIGWIVEHVGKGIFWFGEEMKASARNID